ncbi:MAG: 50S ribosomal protein L23 [Candidatus Eisenbacteria bacterium]|nr:50S ribosomal protein L23 [Candidatus Eisenbacteria bacterium]
MKEPRTIIRLPLVSEKGTVLRAKNNAYVFQVAPESNKIEIANAIKSIFKVEVATVRTLNVKGKPKRMGRYEGKRADWKKAVVTLKGDSKITIFEDL